MFRSSGSDMQLVFFSSDKLEVERVSLVLAAAGIRCEVRKGCAVRGKFAHLPEAEVWIQTDTDLPRAFMLCVEHNIGFAKRETNLLEMDFYDIAVAA